MSDPRAQTPSLVAPAARKPLVVEYVWCSGKDTHHDIRSKSRTLWISAEEFANIESRRYSHAELTNIWTPRVPTWNFDGSSTGQNVGHDTEIFIKAVRVFYNPMFKRDHVVSLIALCECYFSNWQPTPDNSRAAARAIFDQDPASHPWFGLEQEYTLYQEGRPLGWPKGGYPAPQGDYYCANGLFVIGRSLVEEHYATCLAMGITISGTNAEVLFAQWEFQVGPCEGIECGDHMLMARWVFIRLAEKQGIDVNFDAKPVQGDWNGSGMHTNFSTEAMRVAPGGHQAILDAVERLRATRAKDIVMYGKANNLRLSGKHETSKWSEFTYGYGTRHTSCRIANQVKTDDCGYFEDRRPASDADPYLVSARLFASVSGVDDSALAPHAERQRQPWMA